MGATSSPWPALSFNGLANAPISAINAGAHASPAFAGDTVYAWSEVPDKAETLRQVSVHCGCGWSAPIATPCAGMMGSTRPGFQLT